MAKGKEGKVDVEKITKDLIGSMKKELGKQIDLNKVERTTLEQTLKQYGKGAAASAVVGAAAGWWLPIVGPISGAVIGAGGYLGLKAYRAYKKATKE